MLAIQMTCCLPLQRTPLASSGFLNRSGAGRSVKSSELHRLRGIDAKYDLCHTQQRVESSVQSLTGEEGGWLRLQLQLRLQVKLAGISASVSVSVCARKKARMCAAANGRRGKERHWWFLHLPLLLHLLLLLLCETRSQWPAVLTVGCARIRVEAAARCSLPTTFFSSPFSFSIIAAALRIVVSSVCN